ncbi:hypothetical protein Zmor_002514 [Zophobas morio]|uniref:Microtubule-associated protein n=1 Tax=Zophobas morio TaxID=2755281 RepID=A0AA38J0T8_9CUCU|nr:hypothetical protein Zmor_002514 [Zophobas morio]
MSDNSEGRADIDIYVDGAKTDSGSGAGIYSEQLNAQISVPLGTHTSVLQTELMGIMLGARIIAEREIGNKSIRILTDSKSALLALDSCMRNSVVLCWIKGHSGNEGNERADEMAKRAARMPFWGPEPAITPSVALSNELVKQYTHRRHEQIWATLSSCRHSRACMATPDLCNFVVHDRCLKTVVSPCSSIAASLIKNPVAHCWSEPFHHKRKFCNVCRKRLDDSVSIHCEICEYYVHTECQDFAVADCKENATYLPGKQLSNVHHQHHWREGNLPSNSKCALCKKTCWTTECLSGYRCEWCGMTCHAACHVNITSECTFGVLEPIYLPPHAVSIPRTEVPMEAIIGVQVRRKDTMSPRSISEEFSSGDAGRYRESEDYGQAHTPGRDSRQDKTNKDKEDRDEEVIKVYDGNNSLRRRIFRTIVVSRQAPLKQVLTQALRAFHITKDPSSFHLTDLYSPDEAVLQDPTPVVTLHRKEGKRPAVFLRFKDRDNDKGEVRVYPGKLQVSQALCTVPVDSNTTVGDLIREALKRFGLEDYNCEDYRCSEIQQQKLQWNAKSKIGSLENATHKPKGGEKKIESVKLDFKEKAKSKVGSKDNIKHVPGGGDIKIENKKLDIKAQSKVGSMDNVKHRPGGGEKKIFDDKEYLKQRSTISSENHSLSGSQNSLPSQPEAGGPVADENLNQER